MWTQADSGAVFLVDAGNVTPSISRPGDLNGPTGEPKRP